MVTEKFILMDCNERNYKSVDKSEPDVKYKNDGKIDINEFTKNIFTDILYNMEFKKEFWELATATILGDLSISFGDTSLYTGTYYQTEVDYHFETLEINRKIIEEE